MILITFLEKNVLNLKYKCVKNFSWIKNIICSSYFFQIFMPCTGFALMF